MDPRSCCILNAGDGAWAFAKVADQLARALWLDVSEQPREFNYVLHTEPAGPVVAGESFIPFEAVRLAADKRLLAGVFNAAGVPTPETRLIGSPACRTARP